MDRHEAEEIIAEVKKLEPKVEAAFAEYEKLNKQLRAVVMEEEQ